MRGADQNQGSMYSYVTMERRISEDPRSGGPSAGADGFSAGCDVCVWRASIDCTGASFTGAAFDGSVLDPIGASVDGATGLQPVVPVVCGS